MKKLRLPVFEVKSDNRVAGPVRAKLGNLLYYIGLLGLPLGFGMVVGFYVADRGVRWLPTMLAIFLGICVVSLLLIVGGRMIEGSDVKQTNQGYKVRRRVIFCLVLGGVGILARLGVYWTQQPCPLTSMSAGEFNEVFQIDAHQFAQYDKGLERLLALIEKRAEMFSPDSEQVLTADQEKFLRDVWLTIYDYAFAQDQIRVFYEDWYRFDPSRIERSFHLRSFLLTFAAELSLYEKSSRLVELICRNSNAVKFLDAPHPGGSLGADSFSRFRQQLQGTRDLARVVAGKNYLLWLDSGLDGRNEAKALGCGWLWDKVESELAMIDGLSPVGLAVQTIDSDLEVFKRAVNRVWFPAQRGVAKWMGDTRVKRVGSYLISREQRDEMDKMLAPGDILLARKNWYLSNVGLPGFWPHAILYIGSPDKFHAYFDVPEVAVYVCELTGEKMSLGEYLAKKYPVRWLRYKLGLSGDKYCVIEAVSPGVVLNTLEGATGDYMAAMRPRLDKKTKAQAIIEAFGHLDKPYDYNFDFATDHALVCTELVWRSYREADGKKGLRFDLVDIAGRKTLPANEIAKTFANEYDQPDAQLDFVCFIDAREKTRQTFFSDKEAFMESHKRPKWSFALD